MSNIAELPQVTLSDISRVLRAIADELDNGLYPNAANILVILEERNHSVHLFGGGGTDYYRAMTLLTRGQHKLVDQNK